MGLEGTPRGRQVLLRFVPVFPQVRCPELDSSGGLLCAYQGGTITACVLPPHAWYNTPEGDQPLLQLQPIAESESAWLSEESAVENSPREPAGIHRTGLVWTGSLRSTQSTVGLGCPAEGLAGRTVALDCSVHRAGRVARLTGASGGSRGHQFSRREHSRSPRRVSVPLSPEPVHVDSSCLVLLLR